MSRSWLVCPVVIVAALHVSGCGDSGGSGTDSGGSTGNGGATGGGPGGATGTAGAGGAAGGTAGGPGPAAHVLVSDLAETVPAGYCVSVEGPYSLPAGATSAFAVTDYDGTDVMDVTIVDYGVFGCDLLAGYGTEYAVTSVSAGTGSVPSGFYDFVVRCDNPLLSCLFFLDWTANY